MGIVVISTFVGIVVISTFVGIVHSKLIFVTAATTGGSVLFQASVLCHRERDLSKVYRKNVKTVMKMPDAQHPAM